MRSLARACVSCRENTLNDAIKLNAFAKPTEITFNSRSFISSISFRTSMGERVRHMQAYLERVLLTFIDVVPVRSLGRFLEPALGFIVSMSAAVWRRRRDTKT